MFLFSLQYTKVSWVRHRDIHLLTVGRYTYTSDQRFEASHLPHTEEWILKIRYAQQKDSGVYECQISTTPPMGHPVYLNVVGECQEFVNAIQSVLLQGWYCFTLISLIVPFNVIITRDIQKRKPKNVFMILILILWYVVYVISKPITNKYSLSFSCFLVGNSLELQKNILYNCCDDVHDREQTNVLIAYILGSLKSLLHRNIRQ